jgi:Gpi18-like mannosyltransferase
MALNGLRSAEGRRLALSQIKLGPPPRFSSTEWFLLGTGTVAAFVLRLMLLGSSNPDLRLESHWLHIIRSSGFHSFGLSFSDYTPPYLYYLGASDSFLYPVVRDEIIIKIGPIICDFVLATFVFKLVRLKYRQGPAPIYAYLAVLLAPTVCVNSAYWGQSDAIWTTGIVACLYFILARKELLAFAWLGAAIAFKVQAVFFVPFLVALALKRRVAWTGFLLIPLIYLIAVVPSAIAGRSFWSLLKIYNSQATEYSDLTLYAANIYQWVPNNAHQLARPATFWGLLVIAGLIAALASQQSGLNDTQLVACATASVLVVPFVLPHMHDRYFYAADVLSIAFAFYVRGGFMIAIALQVASLFAYGPFLFGSSPISLGVVAIGLLVTIAILLRAIARSFAAPEGQVTLLS